MRGNSFCIRRAAVDPSTQLAQSISARLSAWKWLHSSARAILESKVRAWDRAGELWAPPRGTRLHASACESHAQGIRQHGPILTPQMAMRMDALQHPPSAHLLCSRPASCLASLGGPPRAQCHAASGLWAPVLLPATPAPHMRWTALPLAPSFRPLPPQPVPSCTCPTHAPRGSPPILQALRISACSPRGPFLWKERLLGAKPAAACAASAASMNPWHSSAGAHGAFMPRLPPGTRPRRPRPSTAGRPARTRGPLTMRRPGNGNPMPSASH